jgi:methyl coenzyme M reductase alpha subunit
MRDPPQSQDRERGWRIRQREARVISPDDKLAAFDQAVDQMVALIRRKIVDGAHYEIEQRMGIDHDPCTRTNRPNGAWSFRVDLNGGARE